MEKTGTLVEVVNPKPNSTIMIYDVHASESGALAILDDLYNQVRAYEDKSVKWIFVVSVPEYEETENIKVVRFPWVKKSWGHRYYFDNVTTRNLLKVYKPDKVFSLQNKGISFYKKEQLVYLHLAFILTDYKFELKRDGKKLWLYQNVVSKNIFNSLRKVDKTIVQTQWMKDALVKKAKVRKEDVIVQQPNVLSNDIYKFEDTLENRKRFFYPATAFDYKNHLTLLKALNYVQNNGLKDYELILTIEENESDYTRSLVDYVNKHNLNVKFGGKIPREDVFKMYAESILVFPSHVESFGLPLLEARLTGAYVIASDYAFSREILEGYEKAFYFDGLDFEQLGKLLKEISNCE